MYSLNEKVVYPGHGVAKVNKVVKKNIGGNISVFLELTFLSKEMTILIPQDNVISVGIRKLSSDDKINEIFRILSEKNVITPLASHNSWNKKSKLYRFKVGSGDLIEISKTYRDLQCISKNKELSFGERNLLKQTESLLAEEISLVKNVNEQEAINHLRSFFNNSTVVNNFI